MGSLGSVGNRKMDFGRDGESEALTDADEVETMDTVDVLQGVSSVALQVGFVGIVGRAVEVIVLLEKFLQLGLDVGQFGEFVLVERDLVLTEVFEEAELRGKQEEQGTTGGAETTRGTSNAVDVLARIIRGIELNNPINLGDIETAGRNVSRDEDSAIGVAKLEECGRTLLLFELAVQLENRDLNEVEEFSMELDAVARGHEDDDLLVEILLEEGEEQTKALSAVAHYITLLQTFDSRNVLGRVDVDLKGALAKRKFGQILNVLGLRRREQNRLASLRHQLNDLVHLLLESNVQNSVGFIDDQALEVGKVEAFSVLQMIQETTRRSNDEI